MKQRAPTHIYTLLSVNAHAGSVALPFIFARRAAT